MTKNLLIPLTLASAVAFILPACNQSRHDQPVQQPAPVQTVDRDVRQKIDQISTLLSRAVIENDYDTQLKYFTDDVIINPPLGPAVRGKEELRKGFVRNREAGVLAHSHNTTTKDLWTCGDKVYDRGTWAMSQTVPPSKIPRAYYGSYFAIWSARGDSTYQIEYMIFTLDFNPFEGKG